MLLSSVFRFNEVKVWCSAVQSSLSKCIAPDGPSFVSAQSGLQSQFFEFIKYNKHI